MDPITQGVLGATAALIGTPKRQRKHLATIAWVGALAGMAADLDVLFWSPSDPLLFLDYHRHFTHALVFVPIGALIVATALYFIYFRLRHSLNAVQLYLYCLLGYGTHGLLDCFTTYGTSLLWPFSDARIAWHFISVIDLAFTLPALLLVWLAARQNKAFWARLGGVWMLGYLSLGWVQHERALEGSVKLADLRGHKPTQMSVKPAFGSLLLWKSIYAHKGDYYVDAVRTSFDVTLWAGEHIKVFVQKKHLPWLDANSQQAIDIKRFKHFSDGYLALDKNDSLTIIDARYSMVPNEVDPLWGIRLKADRAADGHVDYFVQRRASEKVGKFWWLLTAKPDETIDQGQP